MAAFGPVRTRERFGISRLTINGPGEKSSYRIRFIRLTRTRQLFFTRAAALLSDDVPEIERIS